MLYFEDLEVGQRWRSFGRTVTDADIVNYAGLSGDFNPLHMDEVWAREGGPFGRRIAHGLLVTVLSGGLKYPDMPPMSTYAYVEAVRRFVRPVFPGDTLHAERTIKQLRPSRSRPETGVVTVEFVASNQDGVPVQIGHDIALITRRSPPAPA
jgi:acyl dehydratase